MEKYKPGPSGLQQDESGPSDLDDHGLEFNLEFEDGIRPRSDSDALKACKERIKEHFQVFQSNMEKFCKNPKSDQNLVNKFSPFVGDTFEEIFSIFNCTSNENKMLMYKYFLVNMRSTKVNHIQYRIYCISYRIFNLYCSEIRGS